MGYFLNKKSNFSMIPNEVLRDSDLSRKAKGLYCEIFSYVSIPNFKLSKSYLVEKGLEGETAFNSMWNELKKSGYLKQYRISTKDETGKIVFEYAYDLLASKDPKTPYLVNIKSDGTMGKTQGFDCEYNLDFAYPMFSTLCKPYPIQNLPYINNTDTNNTDINNIKKKSNINITPKKRREKDCQETLIRDFTDNEELRLAVQEYVTMRKQLRKPITGRGLELALNKLQRLSANVDGQIAILEQSIMNSWQGLFELKDDPNKGRKASYNIEEYKGFCRETLMEGYPPKAAYRRNYDGFAEVLDDEAKRLNIDLNGDFLDGQRRHHKTFEGAKTGISGFLSQFV